MIEFPYLARLINYWCLPTYPRIFSKRQNSWRQEFCSNWNLPLLIRIIWEFSWSCVENYKHVLPCAIVHAMPPFWHLGRTFTQESWVLHVTFLLVEKFAYILGAKKYKIHVAWTFPCSTHTVYWQRIACSSVSKWITELLIQKLIYKFIILISRKFRYRAWNPNVPC